MRRRSALIGAFLLVATVGGCAGAGSPPSPEARRGGSITVALEREPASLDPAVASTAEELRAVWLAYTPPLTYARADGAAGTRLVPGLARDLPEVSDDGLRVSFRVSPGLRYAGGRPVVLRDFERGIRRSLQLNPRGEELFGAIVGARASARSLLGRSSLAGVDIEAGERRVTFRLEAPDPGFLHALASPAAAPVPAGTPIRDLGGRPPPGVGPYRFAPPRRGRAFRLVRARRFDLPGIPAGNVDEIEGQVRSDPGDRTRAAIDGFLDAAEGEPPLDLLPTIRSEYDRRYTEHPTLAVDMVAMDHGRAPFSDRSARRALAFALDEATLARLRDGFLDPACNVIAPGVSGYEPADPCPYGEREGDSDLVRAQTLLEDVGLAGDATVLVAPGPDPRSVRAATYLAGTLRKLGLVARVARTPAERGRAQASIVRRRADPPTPEGYLAGTGDAVLAGRVALLRLEEQDEAAAEQWAELDRLAVDEADLAPYGVETQGVLLSKRMDAENCERYHPVRGLDWSSLCLR